MFAHLNPVSLYARFRPALGDGTSSLIGLHILRTVLRLGSNLIITRLLAPEAYGVLAIVTAISYLLTMVTDMGLRAFITRHATADTELLQTVWTVRFLRNLVLAACMFFGAGLFANLYSAPEVTLAIRVASALFLLDSMSSLGYLTSERERRVLRLSVLDFVKFLFVTTVTIIAAYFLRNYWAVIISMFVGAIYAVSTSYFLLPHSPVRFRLNMKHVAELWRFSRFIIPSSMISIILTQTDKFFLANYFPLATLGKYMLASTIAIAVGSLVSQYVMRVFYPLFTQTIRRDPERARAVYYGSRRRMTLWLAFGIGGLIGGADLVVQVLFNDLYLGAGLFLSIVCINPLVRLMTFPASQALIATGFVRVTLIGNIFRVFWVFTAGPAAYYLSGPLAVIVVLNLTELVMLPFFWWHQRRIGVLQFREEISVFAIAGIGAAIGYAAKLAAAAMIAAGYLPHF